MRARRWISMALLLCLGLACEKALPIPPDVATLEEGARWVGAKSDLALGEPLDLELWVAIRRPDGQPEDQPKDQPKVQLRGEPVQPTFTLPKLEAGRLAPRGEARRTQQGDKLYWMRPYRLTWFRLAEQSLPSFEIRVAGNEAKLATQSLDFEIATVLTDKDGKEAEIPTELFQDAPRSLRWWYWILGFVVLAAAFGWWLQHRLKGRMHEVESGPQISPIEEARVRLAEIEKDWEARRLDGDSLVVAVSQVLRRYLQKGLGFHSLTGTTEEFLDELRSSSRVPASVEKPLAGFLQQCDLIKFAGQDADEELCLALLEKTRLLLDEAEKLASQAGAEESGGPPSAVPAAREEVA